MKRLVLVALVTAACSGQEEFSDWEWSQLKSLSNLPATPPPDTSNKYIGNADVIALGHQWYFDTQFSGRAQYLDMLGRRTIDGRAPMGQEIGISCNTCHEVTAGGSDHSSVPRNVSIGVGAYDVNTNQTFNSAYYAVNYWNGRNDSLWSQIVSVEESDVSMGGDRMKVVWRIVDAYKDAYNKAFPDWPLPAGMDSVANEAARENPDGTCKLDSSNQCPTQFCNEVTVASSNQTYCLPKYPLRGKPGYEGYNLGYVPDGTNRVCEWGVTLARPEPFGDAFDCMDFADQKKITRIYVNFAKAIAAYEYTLVSRDAAFDKFVNEGQDSSAISAAAKRGAKLFVGKASCIDCHNTPLFSDSEFHNVGIAQTGAYVPGMADCPSGGWCDCVSDDQLQPTNCLPQGARDGLRKLQSSKFRRDSFYSDDATCVAGNALHAQPEYAAAHPTECDGKVKWYSAVRDKDTASSWIGRWRTPSLRDVSLTGPYMHTGIYTTLQDVVWHYNWGGIAGGSYLGEKDPRIHPLELTDDEVGDLVEFLKTLNGNPDPATIANPTLPAASPFPQ